MTAKAAAARAPPGSGPLPRRAEKAHPLGVSRAVAIGGGHDAPERVRSARALGSARHPSPPCAAIGRPPADTRPARHRRPARRQWRLRCAGRAAAIRRPGPAAALRGSRFEREIHTQTVRLGLTVKEVPPRSAWSTPSHHSASRSATLSDACTNGRSSTATRSSRRSTNTTRGHRDGSRPTNSSGGGRRRVPRPLATHPPCLTPSACPRRAFGLHGEQALGALTPNPGHGRGCSQRGRRPR